MQTKAERIKQTLRQTKERRKLQACHVYELKLDKSRLSESVHSSLSRLFLEAKWFYNAVLASEDFTHFETKVKQVEVKVEDHFEMRQLTVLSSQMKQGLLARIRNAVAGLATLKKKGRKVGRIKFRHFITSIPLMQYGNTYTFPDSCHVKIQKIAEPLRVFGTEQLKDTEIANANLIQRSGDYFLRVTCYRNREANAEKPFSSVGIDFNIEAGCQMVLSNGIAIGFDVPSDTKRIKGLQKKLARQDRNNKKHGRNKHTSKRRKTQQKLQRAYDHLNNQKREIRNQVVKVLNDTFQTLCFQKEDVKGWQKLWGKRIQATALAGIMQQLKSLPTVRVLDRFVPTSRECSGCGYHHTGLTLADKQWVCPCCRRIHNRHMNAAVNMLPRLERASTAVENASSAGMLLDKLSKLSHIRVRSLVETATSPA